MRALPLLFSMFFLVALATASNVLAEEQVAASSPGFDAQLAQELGADDYGMRSYVFCILKTGPAKIEETDKMNAIFRGHFSNMKTLAEKGLLVLAGPFVDAAPWRGMYIFNVESIEDAVKLVESDPAVVAGVFEYELKKYYGSAALMQVNELHQRIQKLNIE